MTCNSCGEQPKNIAKDLTKAVIEINNPESLVLLRKVVIPISMGTEEDVPVSIGKYFNVILYYEANSHVYIYSSDGIPTQITATIPQEIFDSIESLKSADVYLQNQISLKVNIADLATVATTGSYTDLTNKPTIDNYLSLNSLRAPTNSIVSRAINKDVMTDLSLNANTSTTTVQLDGAKENLFSGATTSKNIALPVASTTQAGVMNASTYTALVSNTANLNAIMNGAVAIAGISANPSQLELTEAWQEEAGFTTLINRASIYDVTNDKVWTYYSNDETWHAAANTAQVSINTFTNLSEGTIKGSINVGQIFAEEDGTGSVNGWDSLSSAVATNTLNITSLQGAMPTVFTTNEWNALWA